jgi:hypothetical protein
VKSYLTWKQKITSLGSSATLGLPGLLSALWDLNKMAALSLFFGLIEQETFCTDLLKSRDTHMQARKSSAKFQVTF